MKIFKKACWLCIFTSFLILTTPKAGRNKFSSIFRFFSDIFTQKSIKTGGKTVHSQKLVDTQRWLTHWWGYLIFLFSCSFFSLFVNFKLNFDLQTSWKHLKEGPDEKPISDESSRWQKQVKLSFFQNSSQKMVKKCFWPAFGCLSHPKAGQNTHHLLMDMRLNTMRILLKVVSRFDVTSPTT